MNYSIGDVAQIMGVSTSTIRYYDREGLLLKVMRSPGGKRIFDDFDIKWLRMIESMRTADMSIEEIHRYVQLYIEGDEKLQERYDIVRTRKEIVEEKIKKLQDSLEVLKFKCWYYEVSLENGSANEAHRRMIANEMPEEILAYHRKHQTPVPTAPLYNLYDISGYKAPQE